MTTEMTRPFWTATEPPQDVTVLICQNKTPDLIRLCLESLLMFYPTIPVFIVNGTIGDEASEYIRFRERTHANVKVWDRVGYDSHGVAMHEATMRIETKYILTLDSDVIIKRGGWIEDMLDIMNLTKRLIQENVFATGMLMQVTDSNYAIGLPKDESDILRYIHPSTSLFSRDIYIELLKRNNKAAFADHGAPSVYTMKAARDQGYSVIGYPVEDYVMHLSGASWTSPRTVWSCDNDIMLRPLVTFISDVYIFQVDKDYDIVPTFLESEGDYIIHGKESKKVKNNRFDQRLRLMGEYICPVELGKYIPADLLGKLRKAPVENEVIIDGVTFYRRHYYQSEIAWN